MNNINVTLTLKPNGDPITALSEALELAKAIKGTVYLNFLDAFSISISPQSHLLDLSKIYQLEMELYKLKKNIK